MKKFIQKQINKYRNPFSLVWKWGFLLTIILFLIAAIWPIATTYNSWQQDKNQYEEDVSQIDQYIIQRLNQLSEDSQSDIEDLFQKKVTITEESLQDEFHNKDMNVQVFSENQTQRYHSFNENLKPAIDKGAEALEKTQNQSVRVETIYHEDQPFLYYVRKTSGNYLSEVKQNLIKHLLITLGCLLFICLIVAFIVALSFLSPLQKMKRLLKTINADNISDLRLNGNHYQGEMTEISESINVLLDKMSAFIEHQTRFVEDVSHELRTPVAVIEGHLKLLNRWGKEDPEVLDESLTASLHEIQRMKVLVQEMLDLTRAGQVDVQFADEQTPVRDVVQSVYQNFQVLYPDFNFFLEDDLKQEYQIQIYRNHLEQILVILLDNAVKYSLDRKEIHITVSVEAIDYIEIAIKDFGEGMSREDQKQVFNRFYRVDKARSRERGGNGLGLSIAQELINGYKGSIFVESAPGAGSNFHVRLPILRLNDE